MPDLNAKYRIHVDTYNTGYGIVAILHQRDNPKQDTERSDKVKYQRSDCADGEHKTVPITTAPSETVKRFLAESKETNQDDEEVAQRHLCLSTRVGQKLETSRRINHPILNLGDDKMHKAE